ncbi:MAG: ATP-binding protein [Bacteroidales bacterium]|nr:ATP-binding protein [Bacteroidales bacterium]
MMSKKSIWITAGAALSALVLALALVLGLSSPSPSRLAAKVSRALGKRIEMLEVHISEELSDPAEIHEFFEDFPEDMVLYRYEMDTLQCWHNTFPILDDDIKPRVGTSKLLTGGSSSPLSELGEEYSFICLGSKWYVARCVSDGRYTKVIAGIEVCSESTGGRKQAFTKKLHIPEGSLISTIADEGSGALVEYNGKPLFLISGPENSKVAFFHDSLLFSPMYYSGGKLWSSYGALMGLNLLIIAAIFFLYSMRKRIAKKVGTDRKKLTVYGILIALLTAAVLAYIIVSFRSLVINSILPLELISFGRGIVLAIIAYVIYTFLAAAAIFLSQMLDPVAYAFFGKSYRPFQIKTLIPIALAIAALFFSMTSVLSSHKEQHKVEVWASRMAVDRDLSLELQLRGIEAGMEADEYFPILLEADGGLELIESRVRNYYLSRPAQSYDITVHRYVPDDAASVRLIQEMIAQGEPISDNSHFVYNYDNAGHSYYAGILTYYSDKSGLTGLIIELRSKSNRENRDFNSVYSASVGPASFVLPDQYSFAKYIDGELISYSGIYPYPTRLNDHYYEKAGSGEKSFVESGHIHFVNHVSDNEIIIISRENVGTLQRTSSFLLVAIIVACCLLPLRSFSKRSRLTSHTTMARKIGRAVLVIIILFVFERNRKDSRKAIATRISTIQRIVETGCQDAADIRDLINPEFKARLDDIARNTKSDLTLYSPHGKAVMSTIPEIYEKMLVGARMNDKAYYHISREYKRLHVQSESYEGRRYLGLYAPVFNRNDEMIAIVCCPYYAPENIMMAAIPHAILLVVIAIVLAVIGQVLVSKYSDMIFGPLASLSGTMSRTDISNLSHIEYNREDEIKSLVTAYNKMVDTVRESSAEIVRAERNKAWSEMARQIAHDIKNPLTPIKLEIQRIMRLKQRNDPSWGDRFDNMAEVVLDQLDMLAKTASDVSTYAKLYTETPVEIDLNQTIKDQLTILDSHDDIEISYMGLENAMITGPRPQIISVVVNLVTNAIQAIENHMKDTLAEGLEPVAGRILICLRRSTKEGFYDIVVEDNGPGVKEENREKLFQPNFTTKTGGTGLGLAMCQSIVDMCGGEIGYSRSFSLGGACFTVKLPKL